MTGSGTAADPYIIYDVDDLQAIENDLSAYYELGGNIDASATSGWNAGAGFDPINLFTGQLDGKGYTISDLFINRPTEYYCGLIGYANGSIVLKNILLTGVDITCKGTSGTLLGYDAGGNVVDIDNCSATGAISGLNGQVGGLIGLLRDGTVDNCWSSCIVTNGSGGNQAGGLIGYNLYGVITDCYATGAVTNESGESGGLMGRLHSGNTTRCYATGDVSGEDWAGGLIGRIASNPTITDCYARGDAAVDAGSGYYAGGFAGNNHTGIINNCYSTGAATGSASVGGFLGEDYGTVTHSFWDTETSGNATSDGGTGKTTAQMKVQATFTDVDWDFDDIWDIFGHCNGGYPCLRDVTPSCERKFKGNPHIDQTIYQHVERIDR